MNKEFMLMQLATGKDKISGRKLKAKIIEILLDDAKEKLSRKAVAPLLPTKRKSKFSITDAIKNFNPESSSV